MTTATAETNGTAPSILVGSRPKKKTGMLTSGLVVIVGLEKSGKSKLVTSAPDSYVIELDAGDADHLEGRICDIVPQRDAEGNIVKTALDVFREQFGAALKDPTIKVIGIDTYNTFVKLQGQEIAEAAGLKSMNDRKEGVNGYALWDEIEARCIRFVDTAKKSGKLIVVTAHCKAPELDEDNHVVIPMGIDAWKKPGNIIARRADLIGYAYKKEVGGVQEYRLSFKGGPLGAWGGRVDALNDKEIRLPKDNPWGALVAAAEGSTAPAKAANETESEGKKSSRRK